jgi:hypothetical protein
MRHRHLVMCLSLAFAAVALPAVAPAQVICISNANPPPELPDYDQPPIPAPGYIWTPGYWAGGPYGYFWVPGTWVLPPEEGLLWTPGYWAWRDGIYLWTAGYWGPHVGFYGGVDYGFGYTGNGYEGGRWERGAFVYNRAVNNFGAVAIPRVYEKPLTAAPGAARVSFNGGSSGTSARPTREQEAAAREQHVAADPAQLHHERTASTDKSLLATENHGRPAIAATAKPGEFKGQGVVAAHEGNATVVPQAVKPPLKPPVLAPGEKSGATVPVERNANAPKTLDVKPREPTPASNALPVHAPPPNPVPPPKEVNRDTKPLAPEVKAHPEVKPLPPLPPPAAAKPAPQVAAPKPPPPPPPPPPKPAAPLKPAPTPPNTKPPQ